MKRVVFFALMIVFINGTSFARKLVAEGKTAYEDFRIETADHPVMINGIALDTYVITYLTSKKTVTIAIDKGRTCRRFITISDKLSVQYVCYGTHFGVEMVDRKYAESGIETAESMLNRTEYFHQKVIALGKTDPIDCMKLIGAYFPALLNEPENITAFR